LRNLHFFNVRFKGEEIFGFWDHPANMWADVSTLPVIEQLAKEKIVRYHIAKQPPTLMERVISIFKRPNQAL
jgi:hypothetical protein